MFEFDDLTAGEAAVHRTEVSLLWLDESPEEWDKTIHGKAGTKFIRFAMKPLIMLWVF